MKNFFYRPIRFHRDAYTKARGRARHISSPQLLGWSNDSITIIWKALDDYQRRRNPIALAELTRGSDILAAVVDELNARAPVDLQLPEDSVSE